MRLPFSTGEFLRVFATYNRSVWPAQLVLYALGLALAITIKLRPMGSRLFVSIGLSLLWTWMGVVYHLVFFRQINVAAAAFGIMFILQAALFLLWGQKHPATPSTPIESKRYLAGGILLGYAFIVYPLLNRLFGHGYPESPTFGAPCPTTIATLGLLIWVRRCPPAWLLIVPLGWVVVGTSAVFVFGMWEDLGLLASGIVAALLLLRHIPERPEPLHVK